MKIDIDSVQSVSIRNEYKNAHCNYAEFFGTYRHPDHLDSNDWCVTLYSVCGELVFETNGNPVWQANDREAFATLLDAYKINIEDVLSEGGK